VTTKLPDEIWDHCEGREIFLLNQIDCDAPAEENGSLEESSSILLEYLCLFKHLRSLLVKNGTIYINLDN